MTALSGVLLPLASPAFLLLAGLWQNTTLTALVLGVVGVVMVLVPLPTLRGTGARHGAEEPEPSPEPAPDRPLSRA